MHISEYQNIFKNEASHFYYVGMHHNIINLLKKSLPKKRNNIILDAGCGTGLLMKKMQTFGEVFGVDISNTALEFAQKRNLKNLKLSSVTKLPFKKERFNAVLSIDVLYHQRVKSDEKAIREFYKVLKPKGILILKLPAFNWLRGKHDTIVQTKKRYTKNEVEQMLKKGGFIIKKISYTNMLIFPIALLKRFFLDKLFSNSTVSDVKPPANFINKTLINVILLENKILNYINFPFGISVIAVAQKPIKN